MKVIGIALSGIFVLALIVSLTFGLQWVGLEWRGFLGPKKADIERKIFKETRSYNEAKVQQLSKYRLQHALAKDQDTKRAIESTVRLVFADYDRTKLSPELRSFLKECKLP